jgi:hypothetical protein
MRGVYWRCGRTVLLVAVISGVLAAPAGANRCVPLFHLDRGSELSLADPASLSTGDFTGDEQVDLAFSRAGLSRDQQHNTFIGVLPARSPGIFGPPAAGLVELPGFSGPALAGELTGDDRLDLVTAGEGLGLVVLAGNGKGGFRVRLGPALAPQARVGAVTDLDRDGNLDVVAAEPPRSAEGADLRVFLGDGVGRFAAKPPLRVASDATSIAPGDVDADGDTDLVVASFAAGWPGVQVLLGDGTGQFAAVASPVAWAEGARGGDIWQVALADFDRDGRLDLVMRPGNAPQLLLALGDGTGRFRQHGPGWISPVHSHAVSLAVGRFDADPVPDVAVGGIKPDATGLITVLRGDGRGGSVEAPGSPYESQVGTTLLSAADLNGDRLDDLVGVDTPTGGSGRLRVLLNAAGRVSPGERVPIREQPAVVRRPLPRTTGDLPAAYASYPDVIYGERVTFRAFLTCGPGVLAGRTLGLYRRVAAAHGGFGRWKRVAARTTGPRGRVGAVDRPAMNAQYQWRPADRRRPRLRRGRVEPVTVAPRITVSTDGDGTVSGRVNPAHPNAEITFYASDGGSGDEGGWTWAGTASVQRSGAFQHRALKGGVEYVALLPAGPRYAAGVSPRFR